jgi:hypothetical protein
MFNERARSRLYHPVGATLDLTCAPHSEPNVHLAQRVTNAFRVAESIADAGAVWEPLLREKQGQLIRWLTNSDTAALAEDLAALGRSEAAQGFFGGAGQHRKCEADPSFAQLLSAWTYDKLLSLAEAVGAVRLELPETGSWGETLKIPAGGLWARIQDKLGIDLSPPDHVGGYLGIKADDCVIQMRVVEAVYAGYRLRQLVEARRLRGHICEIGAGAGLTAYYAMLLGARSYTIIDLPTMNAVQGYMLAGSKIGGDVALAGEAPAHRPIHILPPEAFARLTLGETEIVFNQDSLPEIEPQAARTYLSDAATMGIPLFLSINQEAHLATSTGRQRSVPELVAEVGRYRATSRHRHWLRQGYAEELYELT